MSSFVLPGPFSGKNSDFVASHKSFVAGTYARANVVFKRGQGSYLWDIENRRYLDFTAGIAVNALGHCDPEIARVISEQAKELVHISNYYYNDWNCRLSKLLVERTKNAECMQDATAVFFSNSGSEANEAALKFARKYGKVADPSGRKFEVVSFKGSYHGRTMGSLSATPRSNYQDAFAPLVPGFRYGTYNDVQQLKSLITPTTCAVIVEPIQGEGGVHVATKEFLLSLAMRAREVDAVVIYDEIQCGLGRTGALWAHGYLPAEAHPDILTTAKALGNGFPISATMVNAKVNEILTFGDHGSTYGGNPLGCRIACNTVPRLAGTELLDHVRSMSNILLERLKELQKNHPDLILEIRGRGLLVGMQVSRLAEDIVTEARERGLLIMTALNNTLRLVPSLLITQDEIREACGILEEVFTVMV
ncbi:hypothetical protein G7054_g7730 [Neopestalotiopsis clavispora]|nr:hypothetical protein G7054_g7730 [Neopestalotiopsis clavispora]